MNKKGQALVEFILILPVFLMILFVIVDFGMIFSAKSSLENVIGDIVLMVQGGQDIHSICSYYPEYDIDIQESDNEKYYTILVTDTVHLITPGMNLVLDDPYSIFVKRVVPYEEVE